MATSPTACQSTANHTVPVMSGTREKAESHLVITSRRKEAAVDIGQPMRYDGKLARGAYSRESSPLELTPHPNRLKAFLNRLHLLFVPSEFEKTPVDFLPQDKFEDILKDPSRLRRDKLGEADTILQLMLINSEKANDDDRALANYILDRAKKVFLIAVHIKLEQLHAAMTFFKNNDFDDSCLPLEEWSKGQLRNGSDNHRFARMETYRGKNMERIWEVSSIDSFQKEQWKFQAPIISTAKRNHEFGQHVLPFVVKGTAPSNGAHGIVYKYQIHSAHFEDDQPNNVNPEDQRRLDDAPNCVVAVKAFRQSGEKVALDWDREVNALAEMNRLGKDHIVRFITAFTRGKQEDLEHYVMFEWADGGNLDDFWTGRIHDLWAKQRKPPLTTLLIKWVVKQLHGLADALSAAHYLEGGASYRHGDLKPANILWFPDRTRAGGYGTLKIGDWGEAKKNEQVTSLRHFQGLNTTANFGTRRYEPPETVPKEAKHVRSRLYDIWGIGCIILEFIIWLLYGYDGLKAFNNEDYGIYCHFYEVSQPGHANIHCVVIYWMDHMAKDMLCRQYETALGDLLSLVRTGLLVVKLPEKGGSGTQAEIVQNDNMDRTRPSINIVEADPTELVVVRPREPTRFRATDLEKSLRGISESRRDSYWHQDYDPKPAPVGYNKSLSLSIPPTTRKAKPVSTGLQAPETKRHDYGREPWDPEEWSFAPDHESAARLSSRMENTELNPLHQTQPSAILCAKCQNFTDALPNASPIISFRTQALQQSADSRNCELCCLLWRTYRENSGQDSTTVQFQKVDFTLRMNDAKHLVLTLSRSNDAGSRAQDLQIGFAELPEAGTDLHFDLIQGWLDDCDSKHFDPICKPPRNSSTTGTSNSRLPTRLIYVGDNGDDTVRLQEMRSEDVGDWIALSYRWGPLPHFSTTRQNLSSHIGGIKITKLPRTFQDAIKVTRGLGQQYLWIDSICIVQGEDGDFSDEWQRMEDVYSGAYCVLAASCATGQRSGFLLPRAERKSVALDSKDGSTIYVSSTAANFRDHVLQGALNKRGWVLQEHALAQRTIFFTEYQTYWECGHGVRCETMVKLKNKSAALLGDPDFPNILNPAKHGERILRFQELYQQYSRLELSSNHDRPTAIGGLQQRLLTTMGVDGGFGILNDRGNKGLLRRSLLWHRGEDTASLTSIVFPKHREQVPSWSWMAVSGGIDYFSLNWAGYDWQHIQSPWPRKKDAQFSHAFIGKVQAFDCSAAKRDEHNIVFDDPTNPELLAPMAIILGIEKLLKPIRDKRHYILVVRPKATLMSDSDVVYERVGAGYIPGGCLKGGATDCYLV